MTTFNGEKYIREQIESILKQISLSDELIISDDGSTDSTVQIIEEYQKKYRNIFLFNGPHEGVVKNFEFVLSKSNGDYIFLCDQDDVWNDNKVKKVIDIFKDTNTLLILHDATIIDGEGNIIENSFFAHRKSKKGFLKNVIKNSYLGCCMCIKRPILNIALPFPDKIEMHDWWIGLLGEKIDNPIFIEDKLIKYRRHGNNVSSFHHHPIKKMICNRVYIYISVYKRLIHNILT